MPIGHRVNWFGPPDRPVEGNTIFVRPAAEQAPEGPDETQDGEEGRSALSRTGSAS